MKHRIRILFHPIAVFVLAQVSWGLLMFVWIRWYVLRSQEIEELMKRFTLDERMQSISTIILIQGCVLMAVILLGLFFMFVAFRKQAALNKFQRGILDSVTHELKTPLASVRLHTETLLMRAISEEDRNRFLRKSLGEIERLQHLIDGLLLSARLDGGFTNTEKTSLEIFPFANDSVIQTQERTTNRRNITIQHTKEGNQSFQMEANSEQMQMIFDNLLGNAVKYTAEGGNICCNIVESDSEFKFKVSDNGCGIQKKDLKKIFRRFYRSRVQRSMQVSGTGLGLYVCKTIVEAHLGRIFATSEGIGHGATFYVEFKRTRSPR